MRSLNGFCPYSARCEPSPGLENICKSMYLNGLFAMTKKMRLPGFLLVLALFLSSADPSVTHAQKPATGTGQDDPDFAEFVKKATTKPEFLSPLVDHLPKKAGVPTPKDVLGYHIGTEKKLTYVADQQQYFRAL